MKKTLSDVLRFAVAAGIAVFLVYGWLALSRGPALASDKTVIRIWDWWNPAGNPSLGVFFDKVERDFEAAHPDIDVRYQYIPFGTQYIQKLMSSFAAGNPPDAFQCSIIWATDLYDRGIIRDMNDFLEESPEVAPEAFFPISMSYISRDGRVFGIPTSMDANTLLYNREMFEEAGLDPAPFSMKDWNDFIAYTDKLTIRDDNGKVVRAGFLLSATGDRFSTILPWLGTTGNSFLTGDLMSTNADTPAGIATMQFLYDLLHKHKVSFPPGSERQDFSLFTERKAAMVMGGTWDGYGLKERAPDMKFVMTSYPAWPGEGGRRSTVTWVNMMMMPKGVQAPEGDLGVPALLRRPPGRQGHADHPAAQLSAEGPLRNGRMEGRRSPKTPTSN